jgi:hypothetical protein
VSFHINLKTLISKISHHLGEAQIFNDGELKELLKIRDSAQAAIDLRNSAQGERDVAWNKLMELDDLKPPVGGEGHGSGEPCYDLDDFDFKVIFELGYRELYDIIFVLFKGDSTFFDEYEDWFERNRPQDIIDDRSEYHQLKYYRMRAGV